MFKYNTMFRERCFQITLWTNNYLTSHYFISPFNTLHHITLSNCSCLEFLATKLHSTDRRTNHSKSPLLQLGSSKRRDKQIALQCPSRREQDYVEKHKEANNWAQSAKQLHILGIHIRFS